jgi:Family of unknown function (DUF6521)
MLSTWEERPQELARLLNPAFLGVILWRAVGGYEVTAVQGMPFEFSPLVFPLVLHPATREMLPDIRTTLPTWLQDHRELAVQLADRISELVPFTRESLMFAVRRAVLVIDGNGRIRRGPAQLKGRTSYPRLSNEIGDCWRRAEFVGRWLAEAGPTVTVYGLLGITP